MEDLIRKAIVLMAAPVLATSMSMSSLSFAQSVDESEPAATPTATPSPTPSPTPQPSGQSVPGVGKITFGSRDRFVPGREELTAIGFGNKHINALFGGFEQGASFGLGVEFTTADSIKAVRFSANAIVSFKLYRRFELGAYITKIGSNRNHAEFTFNYQRRTKDPFFGIGPRTSAVQRTNYDIEERDFVALFARNLTKHLSGGIYVGVGNASIQSGQDEKYPSIEKIFSGNPAVQPRTLWAPGLNGGAKLLSYGLGLKYDRRDNSVGLTKGFYLYGRLSSVDGLEKKGRFSDFGWIEADLDVRGYIPLGSDKTSWAMRMLTEHRSPKGESLLLFHDMSFLGGRSYVRGFNNYRFRANNALIFSTELRQTVFLMKEVRGVDIFGFGDGGQVWGDNRSRTDPTILANDRFSSSNWRFALGGGAQYRYNKELAIRVDIARCNERTKVYFVVSRGF